MLERKEIKLLKEIIIMCLLCILITSGGILFGGRLGVWLGNKIVEKRK